MVLWETLFHAFSGCSSFIPAEINQVTFGFDVSDVFREHKREALGRNKSSFLTHFSPEFLFCIPCECQKNIRSSIVSRGFKIGTLRRNGWNYKLCYYLLNLRTAFFKEQLSLTASGFLNRLWENHFYIRYMVFINRPVLAFK